MRKAWAERAAIGSIVAISLAITALSGCGEDEPAETTTPQVPEAPRPLRELVGSTFEALPEVEVDLAKMRLGRRLFHDDILSGDETVSCSTCHSLEAGGAEARRVSTGIRQAQGPINSPTVLNARYNFRQFWDGRAADLLEQAAGPIANPIEMNGDWPTILTRLHANESYVASFNEVYGAGEDPITQANVLGAIVEYENYLVTPSPFDRWLGGDDSALDETQQRGLRAFIDVGCTTCHNGCNIGGGRYQRMGLVHNYFERRGGPLTEADAGRFNVTHDETDRHQFKVPTLRNVALTAPYFHDGSEQALDGAVRTMAYVQLGTELTDAQATDLVAFLGALTGDLPPEAAMPVEAPPTEATDATDVPATEVAPTGEPTLPTE